jgi:hypothetical protein
MHRQPLDMAEVVTWPALLMSHAGWTKVGRSPGELTDASPSDDLAEWQGLTIVDAAGRHFRAVEVTAAWPASRLGRLLCSLANHVIHVRIVVEELPSMPVRELADLVSRVQRIEPSAAWATARDILEAAAEDAI